MSILNPTQLGVAAQVIADETTAGANTAARVGGMFQDIVDSSVYTVKVSVSSAEILALNATPKSLISAPGAGKMVVPLAVSFRLNFVSVAYTTNLNLRLRMNGTLTQNAGILGLGATAYSLQPLAGGVFSTDITNTALTLDIATGEALAGDSTLDVYITYCIVSL